MEEALLTARDIRKIYRKSRREVRALDGISLQIKPGESLAAIGPSGAGKSTLLHILGGLDRPTSGKVSLEGVDIYKLPDRQRAQIRNKRIGFVFQFYHLLPEFTALENVMLARLISGRATQDAARNVLRAVGLEARADHRPAELSGGESQRVAIARALVNEPSILLCDEPTGNLDSKTSESIYEILFGLKSKVKTALIIVTHDEKISQRVDRVVRIKDGRVA